MGHAGGAASLPPCIPVTSMPICLVMLNIWVTLVGSVSLSGTLCCRLGLHRTIGIELGARGDGQRDGYHAKAHTGIPNQPTSHESFSPLHSTTMPCRQEGSFPMECVCLMADECSPA